MIGRVHTVAEDAVHIGVSAVDGAVMSALEEAFGLGLPLRVFALPAAVGGAVTITDLHRFTALAAGLFPAWRWVWHIDSTRSADLFHVAHQGGL